jgi:uncharacterized membrane protein
MEYQVPKSAAERVAVGLGCFSIALGLAELAAPRRVARAIGVPPTDRTDSALRALGAREIGHGLAILARPGEAWPVWARVGGDAIDLAMLGAAVKEDHIEPRRAALAAAGLLGATAADLFCAVQLTREANASVPMTLRGVHVHRGITINKPIGDVFEFWRNCENFPTFMSHLESVTILDHRRSRWRAKAPAGMTVEWDAELVGMRENEWIAWRSIEGSDVRHSGSVRFEHAPGGRGTEIHVELQYIPPAGAIGRAIARLLGEEPDGQIRDDLRRVKQLLETGEIPFSDGPGLWRPAQPPARVGDLLPAGGE